MDQIRVLLRRYLAAAWRYRWATVACAWAVCGLGWVGSTFIPNQYEASARLYVDADAVLTPLLKGLAVDNQVTSQLDVLQRTLLSRPNLEKLVSNTDLDLLISSPSDLEALVQQLGSQIRIIPQTKNLFTISYRNPSPKLSFDVVQTILTTFIESKTGNNRSEMQNAMLFIEQQLAQYERQLRDAEKRRAEFRTKYLDLLPGEGSATSSLDATQAQVRNLQGSLADELSRRELLKGELAAIPPLLVTETDQQQGPAGLSPGAAAAAAAAAAKNTPERAKLQEAVAMLDQMRLQYTDNHPDVIALRKKIELLRRDVASAEAGVAQAVPTDPGNVAAPAQGNTRSRSQPNPVYEKIKVSLVDSESRATSLQRQLADTIKERDRLLEIARGAPGLQAEYTNLNRDYDVLRRSFEELLSRREAMRIASAAEADADKIKIQIVDPPQVPQNPVAPKRLLMVTGILAAGLGIGLALAILLAQFDQSFHTVDELRDLGLPVAGSISLIVVSSRRSQLIAALSFTVALMMLGSVYIGLVVRLTKTTGG
jgi:polysaccharide chain length determinant protein (PEP-CTERM system associated)